MNLLSAKSWYSPSTGVLPHLPQAAHESLVFCPVPTIRQLQVRQVRQVRPVTARACRGLTLNCHMTPEPARVHQRAMGTQ